MNECSWCPGCSHMAPPDKALPEVPPCSFCGHGDCLVHMGDSDLRANLFSESEQRRAFAAEAERRPWRKASRSKVELND